MAFPHAFISYANFDLAFTRIVRGQNKEYKNYFRHLYPSYQLSRRENLEDLIDDLKQGRYQPSPATCIYQPKKSGILRPLRLLTLRDQVVFQAIANVIAEAFRKVQDKYSLTKCFGAILSSKGSPFFYRGWKMSYRAFDSSLAKAHAAGNHHVADFDLVSFYELIDHTLLRSVLSKHVKNPEILDLLLSCLGKWTENHKGASLRHGIPQGPESSAFLAECLLFDFDAMRFKEVVYLRYVDDIKLLAKTEIPVRRALLRLDIASKQLGLVPQAQKIECRYVQDVKDLRKTVPSNLAGVSPASRVTAATHKRLTRIFEASIARSGTRRIVTDDTKFKFALFRMNVDRRVLRRIAPLLLQRPDLSWVFASYLRKFIRNKAAADVLLAALQHDPTYDASASNYIEALDVCVPEHGEPAYRRVIQTSEQRSEEGSLLLRVAASTYRGRRSSPGDALKLIEKEPDPLAKSILTHRLFGISQTAPFKTDRGRALIESMTESADPDLSRFSADLLLEFWPWGKKSWTPKRSANRSVKLLMKSLGLRKRTPKKEGILDRFFKIEMRIGMSIRWRKALGREWRDAERRCLRLQRLRAGDPTSWVLMLDTFNEVLLQVFSNSHASTKGAYKKATRPKEHHPDLGNWLNNPVLAKVIPKGITWFKQVHDVRVKADLAHAKSKRGVRTRAVSFRERDRLERKAQTAWAELIGEWKKIL